MYVAMNTFVINNSRQNEFEEIWTNRERHLQEVPGFVSFLLLRGDESDSKRSYISHSTWKTKEDFWAWTKSEQFHLAHKNNKTPQGIIIGPPQFSGYEVILSE